MTNFTVGILFILLSGFFQGTYGLGMKKFQPLAWEAFWILFSTIGMLIVPFACVWYLVPDPVAALHGVSGSDATMVLFMGALWGIGALLWGFAILRLGISLTYGIGMSITAISGSFGVLLQIEDPLSKPYFWYLVIGNIIMVAGVVFITIAGIIREKEKKQVQTGNGTKRSKLNLMFLLALVGIFLNGIFSGLLNIGFNKAYGAAEVAIQQGVTPANASLVQWLFVFLGGFATQFVYALILLFKNKSYRTYGAPKVFKAYIITLFTALMWFAALAFYGQGSSYMGESGPVLGWTMFIAIALLVSNTWGALVGEWKIKRVARYLVVGNIILLISWIVLGYANSLTS